MEDKHEGMREVFCPVIKRANGTIDPASAHGLKAWHFWVPKKPDDDKENKK